MVYSPYLIPSSNFNYLLSKHLLPQIVRYYVTYVYLLINHDYGSFWVFFTKRFVTRHFVVGSRNLIGLLINTLMLSHFTTYVVYNWLIVNQPYWTTTTILRWPNYRDTIDQGYKQTDLITFDFYHQDSTGCYLIVYYQNVVIINMTFWYNRVINRFYFTDLKVRKFLDVYSIILHTGQKYWNILTGHKWLMVITWLFRGRVTKNTNI